MRLQPGFPRKAVLVGLLAIFSGCGARTAPKDALLSYFNAIAEGDFEAAFESLTAESQEKLDAIGAAMPGGPDGIDVFRASMTTGGPAAVPWITQGALSRVAIETAREDADSATLRVTGPLGASDVRMVRQGGQWRLQLDV